MTEHKFTDEEIIKTLRGCIGALQCEDCPYMEVANCANQHIMDAVDLINRQREELEALRKKKVCSVGDNLYIIVPGGGKDGSDGVEINRVTEVGERFIFFSGSYPPEDDILNNVEIADLGKEVFLDEAAFKQELERRRAKRAVGDACPYEEGVQ